MKRYSASSKKAQQWIKEASKDNLFLCSIYDELGHFRQSESIYESTIKIAKFIRVSEDNPDTVENEDEEDVDVLYIEEVNTGRYDYGDVSGISDYGSVDLPDETSSSKQHINEFIRALSMGGSDVKKGLENLSIAVRRWHNPELHKSSILLALSYYYKNPLIAADQSVFVGNQKLLADDIVKGDIDQDTVALLADFHNKGVEKKKNFINVYQQVNELLKVHKPELANNDHIIKYLLAEISYDNHGLDSFEINSLIGNANTLDVNAVEKALKFTEKARLKMIKGSSNFSYKSLITIVRLFSKYTQDSVFERILGLLDSDPSVYNYSLGFGGFTYIEQSLFGRQNEISTVEMRLYPGLSEALISTPLPSIFSDRNIPYEQRTIKPQFLNPLLISGAPVSSYGMDNYALGTYYFDKRPEALQMMSESYPNVSELSPLWLALGHQMIQMDSVNGKKAFDKLNEIWPNSHSSILYHITPFMIPVYIKYFANYNKDYNLSSKIDNFNNCYLYIGEKLYDYALFEIDEIAGSFDLLTGLPKKGSLSIEQYENIKQHSGNHINQRNADLYNFKYASHVVKFYVNHPYAYQIPIENIDNFTEFVKGNKSTSESTTDNCVKNLFILGKYDPELFDLVSKVGTGYINDQSKDYIAKLITEKGKSEAPFIGNYDSLIGYSNSLNKIDPNLSFTELYACLYNPEQAYKIRDAISKSKNYSHIVPHSEEYNKLFILFAQNYNIRGRDPAMLTNLVDAVLAEHNPNRTYQQFHYMSAALGKFDFSNLSNKTAYSLTRIKFESEVQDNFLCDTFLYETKIKPEHIINLGGFDELFEMSEEQLKEWLESIRFRQPDVFIYSWNKWKPYQMKFSTLPLKLDRNILYNKVLYNFYKTFFDGIRSSNPNIFNDLGPGSEFEKIIQGTAFTNHIFEYKSYIRSNLTDGPECDEELLRVYRLDVKLPRQLLLPKSQLREIMTSFDQKEPLSNIGKIVQIFGNITPRILDAYSFKLCQKNGYPTKGFDSIPDLMLKGQIIHDFANLLPTNLNQKFNGYAQYFLNNFSDDKNGDLKLVGDSWSSRISLWDDNDNVLEEGFVYEFSSRYNVSELSQLIKHNSFRQVMKDLPVESKPFAYQYCDVKGLPTEQDNQSGRYKQLFVGTQQVFLDGLKVKLPDWASFTGESGDLTLRFLRRDEPQGMFLGRLSKCCQEPENWAASCAYDGHLNPNAAFAVFEGPEGLIFQAYVWADENGNVCFDSIESPAYDYRSKYKEDGEKLMINFANSLPPNVLCTVGNNPFGFKYSDNKLKNPTKTNNILYVAELLREFCPSRSSTLYTADSQSQYKVE